MPIGGGGGMDYGGMAGSAMGVIGGVTSSVGGVMSALGAGDGNWGVSRLIKNKDVAAKNNLLLGDWGANRTAGQSALADYIRKYLAGTKDAEVRTGQETGAIDRFYNGGAETELMALRNARSAAINDAATRAMAYARAGLSRSRLTGQGGPSSYDALLAQRTMGDISSRAAMDDAEQARRDWEYMQAQRLGLAGRRTALDDALAARFLAPDLVRRQMFDADTRGLAGLSQIDLANTFYGVNYDPSDLERWGSALQAGGNALMQGGAVAKSGNFTPDAGGGGFSGTGMSANPYSYNYSNLAANLPSNWSSVPPSWQSYSAGVSARNSNPYSPGYVPPGYYE